MTCPPSPCLTPCRPCFRRRFSPILIFSSEGSLKETSTTFASIAQSINCHHSLGANGQDAIGDSPARTSLKFNLTLFSTVSSSVSISKKVPSAARMVTHFPAAKFSNYVYIDVSGLEVTNGRDHVYVVPNQVPLNIAGRVYAVGRNDP